MGFRLRLALALVATLALTQAVTALLVYNVTRRELINEGGRRLAVAAEAFARQLDGVSERVADNVQVLALDYALRSAIAQHDRATILSALRNHGRRVGATRMQLLDLDGLIDADTTESQAIGAPFPYVSLLRNAFDGPSSALVASHGRVNWIVVVPVFVPNLIGLIAAEIPVDDVLLARLQVQSALPHELELVTGSRASGWSVAARAARDGVTLADALAGGELPLQPGVVEAQGRDFVAFARGLEVAPEGAAVTAVLGYSLDDALQPYRPVAIAWAIVTALGLFAALAAALLIARGVARPIEALARTARRIAGGDYAPVGPIPGDGEIGQLAGAFDNMTRAIGEREERIRHQAAHDAVTGLPNRLSAEHAIQRSLVSAPAQAGALLMIGLPRQPETIKTMGHALADRLMRDAAARIRVAAGDGLVARATDTEFAVWLPAVEKAEAITVAFRFLQALAEPYQEGDIAIDTAPAAGVALYPAHGPQASALLQRAEVALFAALGSEDAVSVYDPATDPHRPERLSLMADLRSGIERGQLELHYQPRLHLASGMIDGAEGLARWQHPKRGQIPPDSFIRLAEETANIRRVTRWALAAGVAQAHQWSERGWDVCVAVNVSARDLDDVDLPRRVSDLLSAHGVPARLLKIEITESAVMGKPDAAVQVLRRLADLGVDLAIDDFGVGQSSFAYLRRLPVRELKIDRSFITDLATDRETQTIVHSLVELGHRLGYRVTAEGVEDEATLAQLLRMNCDYAQGFHIGRPMRADAFAQFLETHRLHAGRARA